MDIHVGNINISNVDIGNIDIGNIDIIVGKINTQQTCHIEAMLA